MIPLWVLKKRCDKDQPLISGAMCCCPYLWGSLADCNSLPQQGLVDVVLGVSALQPLDPWLLSAFVSSHTFSAQQLPFFSFLQQQPNHYKNILPQIHKVRTVWGAKPSILFMVCVIFNLNPFLGLKCDDLICYLLLREHSSTYPVILPLRPLNLLVDYPYHSLFLCIFTTFFNTLTTFQIVVKH